LATALPFVLPGLLVYLVFVAGPMLYSLAMSFFDWNLANPLRSEWLGLSNYRTAFGDPVFLRAVVNTVTYAVVTVPIQIALGLIVALLLNEQIRGRPAFRVIYYLPVITNWVIVGVLFKYAFNGQAGFVNYLLRDLIGVIDKNVLWLADPVLALVPVHLVEIWKGVGWCAVIYLAALQGVPKNLLEAATVDGAGALRRFFSITLPLLGGTTLFLIVVRSIGTLNGYVSNIVITEGGQPLDKTHFVLTLMYKTAFGNLEFGYGAAISYVLTVFILGVSLLEIRLLTGRGSSV
jgi:multiple sugar transport system permease protein